MHASPPFFSFFPQFTRDPLNDLAWGDGFTDWHLIKKLNKPEREQFTPAKGMYDPSTPEYLAALEKEISELSPRAGLAVYHYFFDGHHALSGFEQLLLKQRSSLPFFICWANETWSKRWVGLPKDIIIKQQHQLDEGVIKKHAEYLAKLFDLKGYFKHKDRPLLLIYNAQASSKLPHSIELYRKAFLKLGHNPFIGACISHQQPKKQMAPYDFGCEFEPRFFFNTRTHAGLARIGSRVKAVSPKLFEWLGSKRDIFRKHAASRDFRYADYLSGLTNGKLEHNLRTCLEDQPLMRSTFLTWNNTPRYRDRSTVVSHRNIDEKHISNTIKTIKSDLDLPIFVNSWNEWSEGAALEEGMNDHPMRSVFLSALGLNP